MSWTVEDRDKAIRNCEPTFKDDGKQCLNCKHSKDVGEYMGMSCDIWCAQVEYDEVCDQHEAQQIHEACDQHEAQQLHEYEEALVAIVKRNSSSNGSTIMGDGITAKDVLKRWGVTFED